MSFFYAENRIYHLFIFIKYTTVSNIFNFSIRRTYVRNILLSCSGVQHAYVTRSFTSCSAPTVLNVLPHPDLRNWIVGFIDGEGSFNITLSKDEKRPSGFRVICEMPKFIFYVNFKNVLKYIFDYSE